MIVSARDWRAWHEGKAERGEESSHEVSVPIPAWHWFNPKSSGEVARTSYATCTLPFNGDMSLINRKL